MVVLDFSDGDFLLGFFETGISGSKRSDMMSQGLAGDDEEDDVVEQEDDSVNDGEPRHQTRPVVLVRLLLAFTGMGVLKQGSGGETGPSSSSCSSTAAASLDDFFREEIPGEGNVGENPEKESSTKWESHSRSAKSSAGTVSSVEEKEGRSETMEL